MGNLRELVGQAGSLRPIVNRPSWDEAEAARGRLTIGRRLPACPTSSAKFLDIRRPETRLGTRACRVETFSTSSCARKRSRDAARTSAYATSMSAMAMDSSFRNRLLAAFLVSIAPAIAQLRPGD